MGRVGYIGVGGRLRRRYAISGPPAIQASISGLTNNPTHSLTAQIGVALTGAISGLAGGETVVHRWTANGAVISGATTANYTPVAVIDLQALRYAPLVDGAPVQSAAYTVRYASPVAGTLAPVNTIQGGGVIQVNLLAGVTGAGLTFSESEDWTSIAGSTLNVADEVRTDTVMITASNSGGSVTVDQAVTIVAGSGLVTITAFDVGSYSDGKLPVIFDSSAVGQTVHWVVYNDALDAPSKEQIAAGQQQDGTAADDGGSFADGGTFDAAIANGLARGNRRMAITVENAAGLSDVAVSSSFLLDTTEYALSLPQVSTSPGEVNWSATSNFGGAGTIYAALRASVGPQLPVDDIVNITGNAVAGSMDATPNADATNTSLFASVPAGDYVIDIVLVSDFGIPSAVISTAQVTVTISSAEDDFEGPDQPLTSYVGASGTGFTEQVAGATSVIKNGQVRGGVKPQTAITTRNDTAGANQRLTSNVVMINKDTDVPNFSLIVRFVDDQNYYILQYISGASEWRLRKRVGGTVTTLRTWADTFPNGTSRLIVLEVIGTTVRGIIEGVSQDITDTAHASGLAGMRCYGGATSKPDDGWAGETLRYEEAA